MVPLTGIQGLYRGYCRDTYICIYIYMRGRYSLEVRGGGSYLGDYEFGLTWPRTLAKELTACRDKEKQEKILRRKRLKSKTYPGP